MGYKFRSDLPASCPPSSYPSQNPSFHSPQPQKVDEFELIKMRLETRFNDYIVVHENDDGDVVTTFIYPLSINDERLKFFGEEPKNVLWDDVKKVPMLGKLSPVESKIMQITTTKETLIKELEIVL